MDAVRAAGASDAAITDALYVCFAFNLIDRLADAFGWQSWAAESSTGTPGSSCGSATGVVAGLRR